MIAFSLGLLGTVALYYNILRWRLGLESASGLGLGLGPEAVRLLPPPQRHLPPPQRQLPPPQRQLHLCLIRVNYDYKDVTWIKLMIRL